MSDFPYKFLKETKLLTRLFKIYEDEIELPNSAKRNYLRIERQDFAVVVPYDGTNLYLVSQPRYAVKEYSLEFPMGVSRKKSPEETAVEELREETGISSANLKKLGVTWQVPAYINQRGYIYLATDLTIADPDPEEGEFIEIVKLTPEEVENKITENIIKDAATVVAYNLAKKYL